MLHILELLEVSGLEDIVSTRLGQEVVRNMERPTRRIRSWTWITGSWELWGWPKVLKGAHEELGPLWVSGGGDREQQIVSFTGASVGSGARWGLCWVRDFGGPFAGGGCWSWWRPGDCARAGYWGRVLKFWMLQSQVGGGGDRVGGSGWNSGKESG